jgi:hypothetical protein
MTPSQPKTLAWESYALQMTLLRVAGAPLTDIVDALNRQGFSQEPADLQFKALQSAGFCLKEIVPVASRLRWKFSKIIDCLYKGGAKNLNFKPRDLEDLCWLPSSHGMSAEDRFRFVLMFVENKHLLIHLAWLLSRQSPSPILAELLRDAGLDPHSLLLRTRSAIQAEILMERLGMWKWGGLGIPDCLWMGDSVPTFRNRKVPSTHLGLFAPADLAFDACKFGSIAPPLRARTLLIEACHTLRKLEILDVEDLVLVGNSKLERLPAGLYLPGSLFVRDCPRLWLPRGLEVRGDLVIEGLGSHAGLPEGLVVHGKIQVSTNHGVALSA